MKYVAVQPVLDVGLVGRRFVVVQPDVLVCLGKITKHYPKYDGEKHQFNFEVKLDNESGRQDWCLSSDNYDPLGDLVQVKFWTLLERVRRSPAVRVSLAAPAHPTVSVASSCDEPPDTTSLLWLQWKTGQLRQRDTNLTHRAAERLADAERAQRSLASNRSSRRRRRVCMQGPDSESERDNDLQSDSDPAFVP